MLTYPDLTRRSSADLHLHTLASDGTVGVAAILAYTEQETDLAVIAITDHDRLDAARAAQTLARDQGLRLEVIVGEEVTTRAGHLLGLFLEASIAPFRSLRDSVAAIHDAGGLAVPAHPLAFSPSCVPGFALRRLLAESDPRFHPDGLETFNPTPYGRMGAQRPAQFVRAHDLAAIGASDAHALAAIGAGYTLFPGSSAADLRQALENRTTEAGGSFHSPRLAVAIFSAQMRQNGRDMRATMAAWWRADGSGRDLGFPTE